MEGRPDGAPPVCPLRKRAHVGIMTISLNKKADGESARSGVRRDRGTDGIDRYLFRSQRAYEMRSQSLCPGEVIGVHDSQVGLWRARTGLDDQFLQALERMSVRPDLFHGLDATFPDFQDRLDL